MHSQVQKPSPGIRFKFSFLRAKWAELVQLLYQHNDNITRLIDSSEKRWKRSADSFGASRRLDSEIHAARVRLCRLHEAVTRSWRCACLARHLACLLLHDQGDASRRDTNAPDILAEKHAELHFRFRVGSDASLTRPWDFLDVHAKFISERPFPCESEELQSLSTSLSNAMSG